MCRKIGPRAPRQAASAAPIGSPGRQVLSAVGPHRGKPSPPLPFEFNVRSGQVGVTHRPAGPQERQPRDCRQQMLRIVIADGPVNFHRGHHQLLPRFALRLGSSTDKLRPE